MAHPPDSPAPEPIGEPPWRTLLGPGLLALLLVATYWEVVLGGQSFALRDHLLVTTPGRSFIRESLLAGHLPQWWNGVGLGAPFAANANNHGLSPIAWAFSLLPQPLGADLEPLFFLLLFGTGVALLARRFGAGRWEAWLAGALAVTSGFMASLIPSGAMPFVAWMPWMCWAADGLAAAFDSAALVRAGALLSLFVGAQLLAPEPGMFVTAVLLTAAILLVRARDRRWLKVGVGLAAGLVGVGLAAVVLVPAAMFGGTSERAGGLAAGTASVWSLHPARLLELAWPHLLGDPVGRSQNLGMVAANTSSDPNYWPAFSFSAFVGAPLLVLAIFGARRTRGVPLLVFAAVLLLLACGSYTPAFEAFRWVFPPERYMRYPEKHLLGALVIVWVFAAVGIARLGEVRRAVWAFAAATALLALLLGAGLLSSGRLVDELATVARQARTTFVFDARGGVQHALAFGALALGAAAIAAAGVALARVAQLRALGLTLVALTSLALACYDARSVTVLVPRRTERPPLLARVAPGSRVYRADATTWGGSSPASFAEVNYATGAANVATRFGVNVLPGFEVPRSAGMMRFWDEVFPNTDLPTFAALFGVQWGVLNDFATDYGLTSAGVAKDQGFTLVPFPGVRPRAFVASRVVPVASQEQALAALGLPGRNVSLVALETQAPVSAAPPSVTPCATVSRTHGAVELACDSGGGHAVLLDAWARGWTATVDGSPVEILRADGLFRAVPVGPGAHRIRFEYATPGLALGFAISATFAVALLAFVFATGRKRPVHSGEDDPLPEPGRG